MRRVLVALGTALALLLASPAAAQEPVPDEVDALARTAGLPYLAAGLTADLGSDAEPHGALALAEPRAVQHFSAAWVEHADDAAVLDPVTDWVVPWTEDGLPAGLLRITVVDDAPALTGIERDPHVAGALLSWDGQGSLVEESARGRWFALQDGTLVTLHSPASDPVAAGMPVEDYAPEPAPAPVGGSVSALLTETPGTTALTGLVVLLLLSALAFGVSVTAARRRAAPRREATLLRT